MLTILGTILIVLVTVGIGLVVDRKWGILPRKPPPKPLPAGHAPGEAPATALGPNEPVRCACGGDTDAISTERVSYDGRELLVVHSRCRRCGRTRAVFVRA